MPAEPDPTPALVATQRDALAISSAAHRGDSEAIAVLWRNTASREALLFQLGRLPGLLLTGHAAEHGEQVDYPALVEQLLDGLPATSDEIDALISKYTDNEEDHDDRP